MNEFDIIEKYFAGLFTGGNGEVVLAAGDDCAILDVPDGQELCVSTDTFIEGVHFLEGAPGDVVAQRALAASTSDLAAMGASPLCCVLALTMPEADHGWLEVFSGSLGKLTDEWMIPLVGGNLARGTELSLTFTVMGIVPAGRALRRSGAAVGDDVYVSGVPGEAGAGLALLQADSKA
ncbi:MAG: thiamine-monophosphate kinase, partial [Pseudomonadales bacterium]|nr:thiamine-monophosphate kinase [Pseudomonadales bacterium]